MLWVKEKLRNFLATFALMLLAGLPSNGMAGDDVNWRNRALALNDITGNNSIEGEIKTLMDDAAGTKKLLATAGIMAKEKVPPFNYNAAYILGNAALRLNESQIARAFFKICVTDAVKLGSREKLRQAYGGFYVVINQLYLDKKYDVSAQVSQEFLETLEKVNVSDSFKDRVLRQMVRALAKQGKTDEAFRLTNNLIKVRDSDWENVELKGWLERETGKFEDSAKTYEQLLKLVASDKSLSKEEKKELLPDIRYYLSGVYTDLNQIDKATSFLKTLLKDQPDNPGYNNDLGYIWADHDMNLDEAEKMIRKAIDEDRKKRRADKADLKPDEDKDSAAYLDSLGWVLYKKKKYQEAKPYLLQAAEGKEGQHIEIFDHLAEVNIALGDKAGAIAAWKKGLEVAGTSIKEKEKKTEVEKKLKKIQ